MNDNLERAKTLFFDYGCNKGMIVRGSYESLDCKEYLKYGISEAQEAEWRREYIEYWRRQLYQLPDNDLSAVRQLASTHASNALPDLIERAGRGDSYTKLFYALELWNLAYHADRSEVSTTTRKQALKIANDLWYSLVKQPIELTDEHRVTISPDMMKALDASTPEEYVLNYARRKLKETSIRARYVPLVWLLALAGLLLWWFFN